jgi:uracil permease
MISAVGIRNMVDAQVDMDKPASLIIVAVMLVLGLGGAELTIGTATFSGLALAAVVGILLNIIINFQSFKST